MLYSGGAIERVLANWKRHYPHWNLALIKRYLLSLWREVASSLLRYAIWKLKLACVQCGYCLLRGQWGGGGEEENKGTSEDIWQRRARRKRGAAEQEKKGRRRREEISTEKKGSHQEKKNMGGEKGDMMLELELVEYLGGMRHHSAIWWEGSNWFPKLKWWHWLSCKPDFFATVFIKKKKNEPYGISEMLSRTF